MNCRGNPVRLCKSLEVDVIFKFRRQALVLVYVLASLSSALVAAMTPAAAIEVEFATRPVKRDVLALYDSRFETDPGSTRIHRLAEMPLNWLGFKVTYADVNGDLPAASEMQHYRGVLTWFIEPAKDPMKILGWLDAVTAAGVRYVCLGEVAPPEPAVSATLVSRILGRLGLTPSDQFINVTHKVKINVISPDIAGFERPIDKAVPAFRVIQATGATAQVHLSAKLPDAAANAESVLIATSPAGGYAADAFTFFYDATIDKARWILNPFAFFKHSFGDDRFPVPDVTTLAGRRMYFSHIDGDGWNNISEIEGYREQQISAAEVIAKEVIEPYPDLPVTVGLIAGDTLTELGGTEAARASAAKIFALPQVEVASHTYSHPFAWGFYENYDRQAELQRVEAAAHPAVSVMDSFRQFLYRIAGKAEAGDIQTRYVAGGAELPRGYLKQPFNLETEIDQALDVSSNLAPAGKKAAIYLWSGDTEPFAAAIKRTREVGVRNMNGGDTRLDAEFPSVFYVPPISRSVGKERQIYAAMSNENTYTNNWHGPYYGQLMLTETLKNTELPRRLKPFNLYYHMYSGEKPSSLAAIKTFVAEARKSSVIPVNASQYAAIADSFFATGIQQVDAASWTVGQRGDLQTVRLDDADQIDIDDVRSTGVLGATRHASSLYIALDSAVDEALISIRQRDGEGPSFEKGSARLLESRWQLRNKSVEACGFAVDATGFGNGDMTWQTTPNQSFVIETSRDGASLVKQTAVADGTGKLALSLAINAQIPVHIKMTCQDG